VDTPFDGSSSWGTAVHIAYTFVVGAIVVGETVDGTVAVIDEIGRVGSLEVG
jgi:hypothetical protein